MRTLIRFIFRILPDAFVEQLNAVSLEELDNRGLIIWAEDVEEWRDELSI